MSGRYAIQSNISFMDHLSKLSKWPRNQQLNFWIYWQLILLTFRIIRSMRAIKFTFTREPNCWLQVSGANSNTNIWANSWTSIKWQCLLITESPKFLTSMEFYITHLNWQRKSRTRSNFPADAGNRFKYELQQS